MPTTKVRPAQRAEEEGSQRGYGKNKAWACSLPREPRRDAICGNHTDPSHRAPFLHSSDWQRVQAHPISSYGAAGQQQVGVWPDYRCCSSFCCKAGRAAATHTILCDRSCPRPELPCSTGNVSGCPERTDSWTYTSSQALSQVARPAVRLQVPQAETACGRKVLANPPPAPQNLGGFLGCKLHRVQLCFLSTSLSPAKGTPSSVRTAAVSVQLVWGQQLSGPSSLCKLVSRLFAHFSYSLHRCPPGTRQSRHSTLKTSPRETSPSHSNSSQPARPTPSGCQAAPSEKTTPGDPLPASLQSEGQGGSTELSLERCCTYSLCCR